MSRISVSPLQTQDFGTLYRTEGKGCLDKVDNKKMEVKRSKKRDLRSWNGNTYERERIPMKKNSMFVCIKTFNF